MHNFMILTRLQNYIVLPDPDRDDTKLLNFRIVSKHVFLIEQSMWYYAPLLFLVLDELEDRDVGILLLAVNIEPPGNHR